MLFEAKSASGKVNYIYLELFLLDFNDDKIIDASDVRKAVLKLCGNEPISELGMLKNSIMCLDFITLPGKYIPAQKFRKFYCAYAYEPNFTTLIRFPAQHLNFNLNLVAFRDYFV